MENSRLGERLKTLRKIKRYSQQEVADYLKVIRQTYSHYETGRIVPTYKILMKLAELYGISVNSLMELTDMEKMKIMKEQIFQNYLMKNGYWSIIIG